MSKMSIEEYNKLEKEYEKMGYVPIGDLNHPYFIPKPTEEWLEWIAKNKTYPFGYNTDKSSYIAGGGEASPFLIDEAGQWDRRGLIPLNPSKYKITYGAPRGITKRILQLCFFYIGITMTIPFTEGEINNEEDMDIALEHYFFIKKYL